MNHQNNRAADDEMMSSEEAGPRYDSDDVRFVESSSHYRNQSQSPDNEDRYHHDSFEMPNTRGMSL